jgi:hypothetical protein
MSFPGEHPYLNLRFILDYRNYRNYRNWGFHDLRYFLLLVIGLPIFYLLSFYAGCGGYLVSFFEDLGDIFFPFQLFTVFIFFLLPCLSWILLYGYVIIPNEPYVKFCKDDWEAGVEMVIVRGVFSNETETWECPPKPGSTWVKQYIEKDWQCNETYCTADELASPESCFSATVSTTYNADQDVQEMRRRFCYNWSEDNPGCCADYTEIGSTLLRCEYCIPDKEVLWAISTFAGIATFIACIFLLGPFMDMLVDSSEVWGHEVEKAKKEAEEKAKKDAEAAEHGV